MYKNSGKTIRGIATFVAILGILFSVIMGIVAIANEEYIIGIVVVLAGALISWFSVLMLAAFGELVQNSHDILELLKKAEEDRTRRSETPAVYVDITPQEISEVMAAEGLPYGEALTVLRKRKLEEAKK